MELRPFQTGDAARGIHGPARDGGLTVVAAARGAALGMGTIRALALHRDRYLVEIDVEPEFRRRGVGRALYGELQRRKTRPYRLMARAMSSRPERLAFAEALGFTVASTCPCPQVDPGAAVVEDWVARQSPPYGVRVVPADEVPADDLLDAWAGYYQRDHEPYAPTPPLATVRAHLADSQLPSVDLGASVVAVGEGGAIAGVALLHPEVWDGRSFAHCQTTRPEGPAGRRVTACLVAGVLASAARRGLPLVEFEGHDSDADIEVVRSVPAVGADPLTIVLSPA